MLHEPRRYAALPVVGMRGDAADAAHADGCGAEVDPAVPDAQRRYNAAFDDDDRRLRRAPSRIAFHVASVALVALGVVHGAEQVDEFVEFRLADGANGIHSILDKLTNQFSRRSRIIRNTQ